jgi:hypothetical protein
MMLSIFLCVTLFDRVSADPQIFNASMFVNDVFNFGDEIVNDLGQTLEFDTEAGNLSIYNAQSKVTNVILAWAPSDLREGALSDA